MDPFTIPFSHIHATDLPLVGGKGANLGELTNAGFPVPTGFCVTTAAFEQFMAAAPDVDALYAKIEAVSADLETARRIGQEVRDTLLTVAMPPTIGESILEAWRTAGKEAAYAVRSSATAEDLPDASFAGQQDTYLNVIGADALLDAVHRCWISLFTDRAILYRVQNNFPHRDVQISVVVQQMVRSEKSGILFTADPLTGHRHTATIDASFGLGEALVSGLVSPDAYWVDKRNMTIIERQIADKQIAIYPEQEGGICQVELPADQRTQTVLSDQQITELAQLGSQVEAHYNTPQDIEWAIADDNLYLLQARPITSLYPIENLQPADDSLHVYFSVANQQMMTNVMSPLGLSGMATVLPIGQPEGEIETSLLRASGGRLFADLTQLMRHPIFRRIVPAVIGQFDALAPEMLKIATARAEFQRPSTIKLTGSNMRVGLKMVWQLLVNLWWRDLTDFPSKATAHLHAGIKKRQLQIDQAPTAEAKIRAAINGIHTLYKEVFFWIPTAIAGLAATRLIQRIGRGWADADTLEAFDLAYRGNVVTEMNLVIGDLADLARQSPELCDLFTTLGGDSTAFLRKAKRAKGSEPFFTAWDHFLALYGSRASAEIDIRVPRWYEEPLPLLQVIASFLQKEPGSHRLQQDRLVARRKAAAASLIQRAEKRLFGRLWARLMRRLLHVSQNGSVLREHHKYAFVEMLRVAKEAVKEVANQFSAAGQLAQPDDIWFLRWPELLAFAQGELPHAPDLITRRKAEFSRYQQLKPPAILTSDGETPVAKYHLDGAPPGALIGNPVSPGIVEGTVCVIRDPQTETLHPGDILVAPFTDPGWTPLFINAGGLIMEVGGAMTHGSVVAREYGIPAIVGVPQATTVLRTGVRIRLDGNRGIIEILQEEETHDPKNQ